MPSFQFHMLVNGKFKHEEWLILDSLTPGSSTNTKDRATLTSIRIFSITSATRITLGVSRAVASSVLDFVIILQSQSCTFLGAPWQSKMDPYIASRVFDEHLPCSYRRCGINLQISSHVAQKSMQDFVNSNKGKCQQLFLVSKVVPSHLSGACLGREM